ncbi:ATP-binding protein, partial [bacterium]|nr:ATP-binding protein [bacterium]
MVDKTARLQNEPPLLTEVLANLEKDFSSRQQILRQTREKDVEFISQAIFESHVSLQEIAQEFSTYMKRLKNTEPDASFLTEFEIYIKDAGATLANKFQTAERYLLSESERDKTWHNIDLAFDSAFISNEDELVYEIYSLDSESSSDDSKKIEVHISEILAQRLSEILPESRQRAKALMEQGRLDISQQVRAAWDAVYYNLEDTQAGLVNYSPKKLEAMTESLQDGLRRAINRLDDVVVEANRVWDDINNEFQYAQNKVLNEVSADIRQASDGKTRFIKTSKFVQRIVEQARTNWIPGIVRTVTTITGLLKRIAYLPSRLRRVSVELSQIQKAADDYELISVKNLHDRLPAIYSTLFSLKPLVKEEFLVGRQEEYNTLERALLQWNAGKPCSVLHVGEKGTGKTSLINCFQKRFFSDLETLRGTIEKKLTTEAE